MKRFAAIFFIDLVLILFEKSFLPVFFDARFYVDLYLAFTMALFMEEKENEALLSAFIGGLITDFLSVDITTGVSSLIVTTLILVLRASKRFFYKNGLVRVFLALLVFYAYIAISHVGEDVRKMLVSCFSTLVFTFLFKVLINRIFNEKRFS